MCLRIAIWILLAFGMLNKSWNVIGRVSRGHANRGQS